MTPTFQCLEMLWNRICLSSVLLLQYKNLCFNPGPYHIFILKKLKNYTTNFKDDLHNRTLNTLQDDTMTVAS